MRTFNIDEMDGRYQFHQRLTRPFFVRKFVKSQNVSRKKAFVHKICTFNVDELDYRYTSFLDKFVNPGL